MDESSSGFQADGNDHSPLYMQVARKLIQDVRSGRYHADQALPSERLLSEQLDVSRVTARKAIDRLVEQGLVVRRRGSGNYIAPRIELPLSRLSSFSEQLQQRGYQPGSRWLSRQIVPASADELMHLTLAPNSRVARLERLRLADEVVMAYEVSVIPAAILPKPQAVGHSLYEHLARSGHTPVRARQHIRAVNADAELAARLGIAPGQAVLYITRIGYLASGQPVELTSSYCRNDYYDVVAELQRAV